MTIEVLEQAVVRHVGRFVAGEEPSHILFPSPYYCRYATSIMQRNFPAIEFGVLADDWASLVGEQPLGATQPFRRCMVGSVSGICFHYLRARHTQSDELSQFGEANALVVNYEIDEAQCLCCIKDASKESIICSIHISEFLAIYKQVTYVDVDFPPVLPYWDFKHDKPVY